MTTDDLKARLAKVKVGDTVTATTINGFTITGPVKRQASHTHVVDGWAFRYEDGTLGNHFTDLIDHTPAPPRLPTEPGSHVILNDGAHAVVERPDSEYPWRVLGTLSHGSRRFIEDRGVARVIWPEGWEL